MRKRRTIWIMITLMLIGVTTTVMEFDMHCTRAETVQYTYDSLGRIKTAIYSDGTKMIYVYDQNGNIEDVKKEKIQTTQTGNNTEASKTTESGNKTEQNTTTTSGGKTPNTAPRLTAADVKAYNKFKKRTPVIKSLKQVKKGSKRYLKIQIRKFTKVGKYPETGYQIKYATNKKFKKAKTVTLTRHKKKTISAKQWKVTKKKTYYVKVRAYMRTKTGKKIYSRYTKIKKITVK